MASQKYTQAKKENNRRWDAANLDRISVAIAKGEKEKIRAAAAAAGESLNQYMITAVEQRMEREKQQLEHGKEKTEPEGMERQG